MLTRRQRAMAVVLAAGALSASCSKPAPAKSEVAPAAVAAGPAFKVVGPSRQIMLAVTIPASEAVFNAAAEPPTTDEQWVNVERAALSLAESGNLLLIPGRAVDDGDWSRFSHMLIDTAAQAYTAAQAKDSNGVSDAGNVIYEACEGCHKKYMTQAATRAATQ
jgi:cytochrome c556